MPPLTICHCELGHSESLGLIIVGRRVKPAVMKTVYRTLAFVVLAVIVTLVIASWFLTYRMVPNQKAEHKLILIIGTKLFKKTYVDWTSEHDFDNALKQVCDHKGTYTIHKKLDGQEYDAIPCPEILKTVKVTKSKVADNAAAGESAANDPNVMHKVAVAVENKDDIKKVLDALSPTPTPTP
jgi:FlaA1/EpsC-like NDP-sugar epimerase